MGGKKAAPCAEALGLRTAPYTGCTLACALAGCSARSLRYHYVSWSEPGQRLPRFMALGYVNDQPFIHYDSQGDTQRAEPRAPWVWEMEKDDGRFLERETQRFRNAEVFFRENPAQQSRLHTWQRRYGCEILHGDHRNRFWHYGYDGQDFLSLDMETLTWTAASVEAQTTKREWEARTKNAEIYKDYLERECFDSLWRHLDYGRPTLLRKEPPVVRVSRRALNDSRDVLVCQAYGFYPRQISAMWIQDGELQLQNTFYRNVTPNVDGTYNLRLAIEIDSKDWDHYQCRVDHASSAQHLVLDWEPDSSLWPLSASINRKAFQALFIHFNYLEHLYAASFAKSLGAASKTNKQLYNYIKNLETSRHRIKSMNTINN
uniref:Ig-like domain-containing protein n=1 Tax=Varanus komodoensis TaxID=61221 RepID=A0A8D2Q3Y3_VARKO